MGYFGVLTLAVVAILSSGTCNAVNFTRGFIEPKDKLIFREVVLLPPKPNQMVSKNITYPSVGLKPSNSRIISAVRAIDLSKDKIYGSGFASITSGGPKYSSLGLSLQSFRNLGLNFSVEIWGK